MPTHARTPCAVHGCPYLQPCTVHPPRESWRSAYHQAPARATGRNLQAARRRLYQQQQGCCAVCGEAVLFGPKTFIRDHIIPLTEQGPDVERNTQGLCTTCSEAKTHMEAKRGSARWR